MNLLTEGAVAVGWVLMAGIIAAVANELWNEEPQHDSEEMAKSIVASLLLWPLLLLIMLVRGVYTHIGIPIAKCLNSKRT